MPVLTPRYDPLLVMASFVIASLSAYLMLDLAKRVRHDRRGFARALWVGGSLAMGTGIWSMHFVGMLAYTLPIALGYAALPTFVSWLAAVAACAAALRVAAGPLTPRRLACGASAMGLGICSMHYIGMSALAMAPGIVWNPWLVVLSAGIAAGASAASLLIFSWLRTMDRRGRVRWQVAASLVMGAAVCGMHYTGMAAGSVVTGATCLSAGALSGNKLGVLVVLTSLTLIVVMLVTTTVEARLLADTARLARSLKTSNDALKRHADFLDQAEEIALIGSKEVDLINGEALLSAGLYRLFGEPPSTAPVPLGWIAARVPAEERQLVQAIRESLDGDEAFEFQHRIVRRDGEVRIVLHRGRIDRDAEGRSIRLHATLQDITARRQAEQALHDLGHIDLATGLPNRKALLDRLVDAIPAALHEGRTIGLLVIEIDQFRLAHESLGYAAGDHLLKAIAARLLTHAQGADMVAHLGAAQFALLLAGADDAGEAAAQALGLALIAAVAEPFVVAATEIFATCVIGVALCPADAAGADDLLDRAGATAQLARQTDGDPIRFYTPGANARASARLTDEAALRHALERGELYVHYQPQVDLRTGRIIGVEALARWRNATRGEVSPVEFIPLAERIGLMVPIGEFVLRTACADGVRWQAAGLPALRIGVNLSVQQLQHADIADRIQAILAETGLDPHRLGVEITESMLFDKIDHVARTLTQLKGLGVEIALDDFGTGYSNLAYLSKLPIDVLKIDRMFVHETTAPANDVALTRALIDMARGLNMKVLAEGVENESQLALLVASDCDQMQGFYFSRPIDAVAIAALLHEDRRLAPHLLNRRSRNRTLLLVDDEENIVAALQRLLRRDGYHILTAGSGAEGLRLLAENRVDVIVSDQRMPGMTGVEFLRRAKELYPETVRLSLSGYTELQSVTDAINEGAIYKFLTKPWDDERLRAHVDEAFRHKELTDENHDLSARLRSSNSALALANERMERFMLTQNAQIERDGRRLLTISQLIDDIPAPVIGIDDQGLVAFLNSDAAALFPAQHFPLGRPAGQALGPQFDLAWSGGDGMQTSVQLDGRSFHAACRSIGGTASGHGRLLVLTPRVPSSANLHSTLH